jgi:hypothetical protein
MHPNNNNHNVHDELEKEMASTSKAVTERARKNRPKTTCATYDSYGRRFQV